MFKRHLSVYHFMIAVFGLLYILLMIIIYTSCRNNFKDIASNIETSKLKGDMNYIYDVIGEGDWYVEGEKLYKGDVYLGDGTKEAANLSPFLYVEKQTETFSYVFRRCSDQNLSVTKDKNIDYEEGHYIRIAGSTRNPNGESIVGTYMEKRVADIIDKEGVYIGEANVDGGMIYCIYEALYNKSGDIVGCIVVGKNVSEINLLIRKYVYTIIALLGIALFSSGFILMSFIRRIIKDIDSATKYLVNMNKMTAPIKLKSPMFLPIQNSINIYRDVQLELERKRILAETDELTKLKNRVGVDIFLSERFRFAQEKNLYVGVNIIDVDCFKELNDHYGHPKGDEFLVKFAGILKEVCGEIEQERNDEFYYINTRFGGDEFMNVIISENPEFLGELQKKIYEGNERLRYENKFTMIPGKDYVTLSMGAICIIPEKDTTFHDIYKMADAVLYKVKNNGRNGYLMEVQ